jgi:hypothetical protein
VGGISTKTYKIELIKNGHEVKTVSLQEIRELQKNNWWVMAEIGGILQLLSEVREDELDNATRIVLARPVVGG